jgi:hypothetical protein
VIARLTPYATAPLEVDSVLKEIVAVARDRFSRHGHDLDLHAEFFCVDTESGRCLSIVVGEREGMDAEVELARPPSGPPEDYVVWLLQLGGPRDSGVVEGLYARVVRCARTTVPGETALRGFPPPASTEVWARGLLGAETRDVIGFAVATNRDALTLSLEELCSSSVLVGDYNEVPHHFFRA